VELVDDGVFVPVSQREDIDLISWARRP
jgi:hypothetical protein